MPFALLEKKPARPYLRLCKKCAGKGQLSYFDQYQRKVYGPCDHCSSGSGPYALGVSVKCSCQKAAVPFSWALGTEIKHMKRVLEKEDIAVLMALEAALAGEGTAVLLQCEVCGAKYLAKDGPGRRRKISTEKEVADADKEHNRLIASTLVANGIVRDLSKPAGALVAVHPLPTQPAQDAASAVVVRVHVRAGRSPAPTLPLPASAPAPLPPSALPATAWALPPQLGPTAASSYSLSLAMPPDSLMSEGALPAGSPCRPMSPHHSFIHNFQHSRHLSVASAAAAVLGDNAAAELSDSDSEDYTPSVRRAGPSRFSHDLPRPAASSSTQPPSHHPWPEAGAGREAERRSRENPREGVLALSPVQEEGARLQSAGRHLAPRKGPGLQAQPGAHSAISPVSML
ncbi:hypothetical protein V8C86DRAFT_2524516 [Haematococcus lacustris]